MDAETIKKIIDGGEGFTVEFKRNTSALNNDVFETIASFSNRYGGHVFLGVSDNGEILGVNRNAAKDMKKNFVNQLNNPNFIVPSLLLNLEEVEVDGKLILYVYVPVSSQMVMLGSKIFDRTEDADIDITRSIDLVANLVRRKQSDFAERKLFPYATENDLRLEELMPRVRNLVKMRNNKHPWITMTDMEIMKSAGLYEDDKVTGVKGFNLAAILLFGKDEVIRSCTPNYLTDAIFRDENQDRYDDRLVVTSNLIDAYNALIEFIAKHTNDKFFLIDNLTTSVRGFIAREIVSNSLMHRDYSSAFPAKIVIDKEKIYSENWSRAQSVGPIDPNNFSPYPKNPIIALFFMNISYADQLGSGVRNLYKYTKMYSGGEPTLIEGDIFKTIVPLTVEHTRDGINDSINDSINEGIKLSDTEHSILEQLKKDNTLTIVDAVKRVGKSEATVGRAFESLKEKGLINRVGSKKSGYWEILK